MVEVNKFQKGKIYKLVCENDSKIYIGSTCKSLKDRFCSHKCDFKKHGNEETPKKIPYSIQLFKLGSVDIVLIEDYPCKTKKELLARERYWIEKNVELCVNKVIPQRTHNEYYHAHQKQYAKHQKKYYESHKEKHAATAKLYREANKDKIKAEAQIKILCECGGKYNGKHKARHFRTTKHVSYKNNVST